MIRLRQKEHNRPFDILAARTSVIRMTKLFGCSRVIFHSLVRRNKQIGISMDVPRSVDVGQRHRDKTFILLSRIYASGSSRQLYIPDATTFQAR